MPDTIKYDIYKLIVFVKTLEIGKMSKIQDYQSFIDLDVNIIIAKIVWPNLVARKKLFNLDIDLVIFVNRKT